MLIHSCTGDDREAIAIIPFILALGIIIVKKRNYGFYSRDSEDGSALEQESSDLPVSFHSRHAMYSFSSARIRHCQNLKPALLITFPS